MQENSGIAARLIKTTLNKLSQLVSRLIASIAAILVAATLSLIGFILLLTGLLIVQQTLSRIIGIPVRVGHLFSLLSRVFGALASVSQTPHHA